MGGRSILAPGPGGYLHATDSPGEQTVATGSHAWVECRLPGAGWVGFDPTNATFSDERHIRVATGRDYADVSPTRGVFQGSGDAEIKVDVIVNAVGPAGQDETVSGRNRRLERMNVQAENLDGVLVAKVEGRVDSSNSQDFERQLQAAIVDDIGAVVMDLGQLAYISSAGLRVVLLVAKTLGQRNVSISLCSLSDPVQSVFEISGFNRIIQIHDTQADALAAAGK